MDACSFYSMERRNGQQHVALRDGFTDGTYRYYFNDVSTTWYAIEPDCGYAIGSGLSLQAAVADAYSPVRQEILLGAKKSGIYSGYVENFNTALEQAGLSLIDYEELQGLEDLI